MTVVGQKFMLRLAACHLSHPAGEGWGEGGSMGGCTSLILPKAGKPPPSSPDGGRNKVADMVRGRLKLKAWFQTTFSFFASTQYYKIQATTKLDTA